MKICYKCYEKKELKEFGQDFSKIDGKCSYCKECIKKRSKFQRERDPQYYKEYAKRHRDQNKVKLKEAGKIDYYLNYEKRKEQSKKSYEKHKKEISLKRAIKRKTAKEREKSRIRQKLWREKNKSRFSEVVGEWKKRNPQKAAAHSLILWAVKAGVLIRKNICEECGTEKKTEAHHEDYYKPMEVVWLCKSCHVKKHLK
jgi:hypothetical protein